MRNISISQGETLRLSVEVEEDGAVEAEFVATDGTTNVLTSTAPFVDMRADVSTNDTVIPEGSYDYYVRVTWDDGTTDIVPDSSNCIGECIMPQLIVCEVPGVS